MTHEEVYSDSAAEDLARTALPSWRVQGGWLCRIYPAKSYSTGALLTAAIAHLAEAAGHHPDITLRYGSVTVGLRTHTAQAITSKDFALAAQIETLAVGPAS